MARVSPVAPEVAPVATASPTLRDIAWVFLSIGMQSFGGGGAG
jgi:chromate transport protein ChrA